MEMHYRVTLNNMLATKLDGMDMSEPDAVLKAAALLECALAVTEVTPSVKALLIAYQDAITRSGSSFYADEEGAE